MSNKFLKYNGDGDLSQLTDGSFSLNVKSVQISGLVPNTDTSSDGDKKLVSAETVKQKVCMSHQTTPATPPASQVCYYTKSDDVLYQLNSAGVETAIGGLSSGTNGIWQFSIATAGDPASGFFKFDNLTPSSVLEIKINDLNKDGNSMIPILSTLQTNDSILFSNANNSNSKLYVISSIADNVGFFTYQVVLESQSNAANYTNNEDITLQFFPSGNNFNQELNTSDSPQFNNLTLTGDQTLAHIATPSNPPSSYLKIYSKNDDKVYQLTSGGVESLVGDSLSAKFYKQFSTGVLSGGLLTVNGGDNTKYDISDGTGVIVNPATGLATEVTWSGLTAQTFAYVGILTYVLIDSGGNPVAQSTEPTNSEIRDSIYIGVLVHVAAPVINTTNDQQMTILNPSNQIRDFMDALGFINIEGNLLSNSGTALKFSKSEGEMLAFGSNYKNNIKDPHHLTLPAIDTATTGIFQYRMRDGTSSALTLTDIIPNILDDGTPYPGTTYGAQKWGAHRVYSFTSNALKIQPAQFSYNSAAEAKGALGTEGFITESSIAANGLLIGFIITRGGATDLSLTADAEFLSAGKFGSTSSTVAGSVSTLQNAYDNSGINPEILTNGTNGALTLQRGSASDLDAVLEVKNGAGTANFIVYGDGNLTTANTIVQGSNYILSCKDSIGTTVFSVNDKGIIDLPSNIRLGALVAPSISGGLGNIAIGTQAGSTITTESNNTLLGAVTDITAANDYAIGLGYGATTTKSRQLMIGDTGASTNITEVVAGLTATCDLGSPTHAFKDLYLSGSIKPTPSYYDLMTDATTSTFGSFSATDKYYGGVLATNGKIYCIPNLSTSVLEIDPATDARTIFGNISALAGVNRFNGGVLAPNGFIYCIPADAEVILKIDPTNNTVSTFGSLPVLNAKYVLGTLAPNGNIYAIGANTNNILEINTSNDTISTFGTIDAGYNWYGAVLAPNGFIYGVPAFTTSSILKIDPVAKTVSTFSPAGILDGFIGGVLGLDDKIYCIPYSQTTIMAIDTRTDTVSTFGTLPAGASKWQGGVLAPNGLIYGIPTDAGNVLEIDPVNKTVRTFGTTPGVYRGGVIAPNGAIYGIPSTATNILKITPAVNSVANNLNRCLSAYYNKL